MKYKNKYNKRHKHVERIIRIPLIEANRLYKINF